MAKYRCPTCDEMLLVPTSKEGRCHNCGQAIAFPDRDTPLPPATESPTVYVQWAYNRTPTSWLERNGGDLMVCTLVFLLGLCGLIGVVNRHSPDLKNWFTQIVSK